jgi:hypothetical protein
VPVLHRGRPVLIVSPKAHHIVVHPRRRRAEEGANGGHGRLAGMGEGEGEAAGRDPRPARRPGREEGDRQKDRRGAGRA